MTKLLITLFGLNSTFRCFDSGEWFFGASVILIWMTFFIFKAKVEWE